MQSTCIYGNMEKLRRCIFACGSSSAGEASQRMIEMMRLRHSGVRHADCCEPQKVEKSMVRFKAHPR